MLAGDGRAIEAAAARPHLNGVSVAEANVSQTRMPDCFISYSTTDEAFARSIHDHLRMHELQPFLASVSLQPGNPWSPTILSALRDSSWVVFLASRAACQSPFVQQEVGGAVLTRKNLVPIVWDMSPTELPAWTREYQAIDIRGASVATITSRTSDIAEKIKADKRLGALIIAAAIGGLIWASVSNGGK